MNHVGFGVGDVNRALEKLVSKGVDVAVSPSKAKGVTELCLKDLDGMWIE